MKKYVDLVYFLSGERIIKIKDVVRFKTRQALPKMDHEYAVVNKKNRKASYVTATVNKKASS